MCTAIILFIFFNITIYISLISDSEVTCPSHMLAAFFAAFTQFNNLQIALADAHTVQFALKHVSKTKHVDGFVCH